LTALTKNIFATHGRARAFLDENRNSCCTWNWLVLYGNHVCHL